jgi:hypothetical protein
MATEIVIIARLEKLETQNKRLRQVGIISFLLLGVLVVAGRRIEP